MKFRFPRVAVVIFLCSGPFVTLPQASPFLSLILSSIIFVCLPFLIVVFEVTCSIVLVCHNILRCGHTYYLSICFITTAKSLSIMYSNCARSSIFFTVELFKKPLMPYHCKVLEVFFEGLLYRFSSHRYKGRQTVQLPHKLL